MGSPSEGFSVDETAPPELGGGENAFVLNTPTRTFPLLAETSDEKISWLAVIRSSIESPPNPCDDSSVSGITYGTE